MRNRFILSAACLVLSLGQGFPARAGAKSPSVAVRLARLQKGALPHTLLAYGRVQPSDNARRPVMAPLAADVGAIYVRPGQEVAKGTQLLKLLPSPQTAAAYARARSALRVARRLVTGTRQMLAQHLATAQQLADAQKSESDARADLEALRARGGDGPKVRRSPFRAIVAALSAAPGAIVQPGTPLLELLRPDGLVLEVGLQPAAAATVPAAISGPWRTVQPSRPRTARAASSASSTCGSGSTDARGSMASAREPWAASSSSDSGVHASSTRRPAVRWSSRGRRALRAPGRWCPGRGTGAGCGPGIAAGRSSCPGCGAGRARSPTRCCPRSRWRAGWPRP